MITHLGLFALVVLSGSVVAAQQPAPAGAPPQPPAATQASQPSPVKAELGRMFYEPAQRAALDEARRRPPPAVAVAPPVQKLPPPPEYVRLDGVVRRSDGTTSIWLNNRLVEGRRSSEGLEVAASKRAPGNVTVNVPQAGRSVELRVGQQLEVTSGKVQEGYRLPPAHVPAASPVPRAESEPAEPAAKSAARRPARERELLRDLLREIEGPPPERSEPAPPAKG
jgi:hypothetical protein